MQVIAMVMVVVAMSLVSAPARAGDLQALMRRFGDEPTVAEVQRRAVLRAELDVLDRWSTRARLAHALPQLEVRLSWFQRRDSQIRLREDYEADLALDLDETQNNVLDGWQGRQVLALSLRWDLRGLVFARDEIAAAREARARAKRRDALEALVAKLYYRRRALQIDALLDGGTLGDRLARQLEIDRLTAELDALTRGWFAPRCRRTSR